MVNKWVAGSPLPVYFCEGSVRHRGPDATVHLALTLMELVGGKGSRAATCATKYSLSGPILETIVQFIDD